MTVKEIYDACGGGYEEMLAKFRGDNLISKFLTMFTRDVSFDQLTEKLEAGDTEGAFGAAHNLKGVVLNLNLVCMIAPVNAVTEALRAGDLAGGKANYPALKAAYLQVRAALENL